MCTWSVALHPQHLNSGRAFSFFNCLLDFFGAAVVEAAGVVADGVGVGVVAVDDVVSVGSVVADVEEGGAAEEEEAEVFEGSLSRFCFFLSRFAAFFF